MQLSKVAIVMGSASDLPVMRAAADALTELDVPCEVRVLSAHRTPELAREFALTALEKGFRVIIAGAGGAAHLAGFMAAHSLLPVIGVPVASSALNGLDALLATVQMPPGMPVATVAIGEGGARNAGILAAQILAVGDAKLREKLRAHRQRMADKVAADDEKVRRGK